MADKKSLAEDVMNQIKGLEEVIAENAKGILASTMKEEISELVKESLMVEAENKPEGEEDEVDMDDMEDEDEMDSDESDDEMEDEDEVEIDMDMEDEMDMSDSETLDLTNASPEEVAAVFKKLGPNDKIQVVKDGDYLNIKDDEDDSEFLIRMNEEDELDEMDMEDEFDFSDEDSEDLMDKLFSEMYDEEEESYMNEMEDDDMMDEEEEEEAIMYEIEMEDDDMMDEESYMNEMEDDDMMDEEDEVMYEIEMEDDDMMDEEESYMNESMKKPMGKIKPVMSMGMMGRSKMTKPSKKSTSKEMGESKPVVGKGAKLGKASFNYKTNQKSDFDKGRMGGKHEYKIGTGAKLGKAKFEFKEGSLDGAIKKEINPFKKETKEASRTYAFGSKSGRGLRKGFTPNRNLNLESEIDVLRTKNEEYRKALNIFRDKLNEVAVFNSNLAYATRLFTEHSTTKQEKINILKRFDTVETLKESKSVYKVIKDELNSKSVAVNESIEQKIEKPISTGSSNVLVESKTYENPQFLRMKDIMSKIIK
jgi:hypothetical protein